mmetsp:Transcript_58982/g.175491  ORF Transcript_58982/g.175491 Transcript_58982/m.175491 type:complete len:81 (-) Transcript_58982:212-454(-)
MRACVRRTQQKKGEGRLRSERAGSLEKRLLDVSRAFVPDRRAALSAVEGEARLQSEHAGALEKRLLDGSRALSRRIARPL